MTKKMKTAGLILSIGLGMFAAQIFNRGGMKDAWDDNSGGLIITAVVLSWLIARTLLKANPDPQRAHGDE